jgi:hypothetical protein
MEVFAVLQQHAVAVVVVVPRTLSLMFLTIL